MILYSGSRELPEKQSLLQRLHAIRKARLFTAIGRFQWAGKEFEASVKGYGARRQPNFGPHEHRT